MYYVIQFILTLALFVFAYHYERNGDPWKVGDFLSRIFWGVAFAIGYIALMGTESTLLAASLYGLMATVEIFVPHAWVQNMGNWPTPQKRWPGFYLKAITTWTPNSEAATLHDFLGMMGVGFFRGFIVFAIPLIISLFFPVLSVSVLGALSGWLTTTFGQPTAYLVGRYTPFKKWGNEPYTASWGEFFTGCAWAVALLAAVTL